MKTLDWRQPQPVTYAIPGWLRDEQIRLAIQRTTRRLQAVEQPRAEPVAVVGYGPSLADTWEKVRGFEYVISCSGSHRFLIDRGIVPTWHVEVDPRAHKIALLGAPHPDVEYLVASTCHPTYYDHLEGARVTLWHVFDASAEGQRLLPPGEWAVTGGCDVGLRSLTLAAFLGFRDVHVFGLDGCARDGMRHAGDHPNGRQTYSRVEYGGKEYLTTGAMLEAARGVAHELDQMPLVRATFYGAGLIQAMQRDRTPQPCVSAVANAVGFRRPPLITEEYRALNAALHRSNLAYGAGGGRYADTVRKIAASVATSAILDYGCGKGYLGKALAEHGVPIWEYDPAIPGKDDSPRPADVVACLDVLEHIEPDRLPFVLDDLRRVTRRVGYLVIHTGPSSKALADGRNAHLIQQGRAWWERALAPFFTVAKVFETPPLLHVVVGPKGIR